jgi:hypothetical protein
VEKNHLSEYSNTSLQSSNMCRNRKHEFLFQCDWIHHHMKSLTHSLKTTNKPEIGIWNTLFSATAQIRLLWYYPSLKFTINKQCEIFASWMSIQKSFLSTNFQSTQLLKEKWCTWCHTAIKAWVVDVRKVLKEVFLSFSTKFRMKNCMVVSLNLCLRGKYQSSIHLL